MMKFPASLCCWFLLSVVTNNSAAANNSAAHEQAITTNCPSPTVHTPLMAIYDLKHNDQSQSIILYRSHHQVAYEFPQQQRFNQWRLDKHQRLSTQHYFDQFERVIDYQASDLKRQGKQLWLSKFHLIHPQLKDQLKRQPKPARDCLNEEHFQGQIAGKQVELIWSQALQLPIYYRESQGQDETQYRLQQHSLELTKIEQAWHKRQDYQHTDYADIGDRESDPFLKKMIRLGFKPRL